ncbi:MAG: CoA transferase, partial [Gammaproteobacteria bacterium]
ALRERFAAIFRTKTRDEWCALMEGRDICFAPVLGLDEVADHPHMAARGTFYRDEGAWQPAPAPRFSRSRPARPARAVTANADTDAILGSLGMDASEREALRKEGVID